MKEKEEEGNREEEEEEEEEKKKKTKKWKKKSLPNNKMPMYDLHSDLSSSHITLLFPSLPTRC